MNLNIGLLTAAALLSVGLLFSLQQKSKLIAQMNEERAVAQVMLAEMQKKHIVETNALVKQLEEVNADHAKEIADIQSGLVQRLRESETRYSAYRQWAESGTAECQRLASYAAELDRTIEQGRSLVEEFRSTVKQRDGQLRALGTQIHADRKLLGE